MVTEFKKRYINTTVSSEILKSLKVLAAQEEKRINQLLEEAIEDLLKKYKKTVFRYNAGMEKAELEKLNETGQVKRVVKIAKENE